MRRLDRLELELLVLRGVVSELERAADHNTIVNPGTTRLLSANTTIPNDPKLVGAKVWFQAITDGAARLQLTDVVPVAIR